MDTDLNLTDFFVQLLESSRRVDLAEAEFKRMLADDDDLRHAYKEWCQENGHTLRNGFTDFAEEYYGDREDNWESLNEYDEDE